MSDHEPGIVMDGPNLFADLGFEDSDELLIKAELMTAILERMKDKKLNQTQAALAMAMPRQEVSHLVKGHIDRFTIDRLIKALHHLDATVQPRLMLVPRVANAS
jgi:predicted XRE-type DNA-binding protein